MLDEVINFWFHEIVNALASGKNRIFLEHQIGDSHRKAELAVEYVAQEFQDYTISFPVEVGNGFIVGIAYHG